MSETRGGYTRSVTGLMGAFAMSLLLIAAIWGLSRLQNQDRADPVPAVDFSGSLAQARAEAPFDVFAPDPVPPGWRATSVRWVGAGPEVLWHLGFLTTTGPDAEYVGLDQGTALPNVLLAATTTADQPGAPVMLAGASWRTLTSADGREKALMLEGDAATTIVSGTASRSVLAGFAESLSTS